MSIDYHRSEQDVTGRDELAFAGMTDEHSQRYRALVDVLRRLDDTEFVMAMEGFETYRWFSPGSNHQAAVLAFPARSEATDVMDADTAAWSQGLREGLGENSEAGRSRGYVRIVYLSPLLEDEDYRDVLETVAQQLATMMLSHKQFQANLKRRRWDPVDVDTLADHWLYGYSPGTEE